MKIQKFCFLTGILTLSFFLGFTCGRHKDLDITDAVDIISHSYSSLSYNSEKSEETLKDLRAHFYQLMNMLFFDDTRADYVYDYKETEDVILEILMSEFRLCERENTAIDSSKVLKAHLSAWASIISSSEYGSHEQKEKIFFLGRMLHSIKSANPQVYVDFLESNIDQFYYSALIEILADIEAAENDSLGKRSRLRSKAANELEESKKLSTGEQ